MSTTLLNAAILSFILLCCHYELSVCTENADPFTKRNWSCRTGSVSKSKQSEEALHFETTSYHVVLTT